MFYCSKCAINLLQQNFKIEELKEDEPDCRSNSLRLQQITKFELRLKGLEDRARCETERNYIKEEIDLIEEEIMNSNNTFDTMAEVLQKMRKEWIANLNNLRIKVNILPFRKKTMKKQEKVTYSK